MVLRKLILLIAVLKGVAVHDLHISPVEQQAEVKCPVTGLNQCHLACWQDTSKCAFRGTADLSEASRDNEMSWEMCLEKKRGCQEECIAASRTREKKGRWGLGLIICSIPAEKFAEPIGSMFDVELISGTMVY